MCHGTTDTESETGSGSKLVDFEKPFKKFVVALFWGDTYSCVAHPDATMPHLVGTSKRNLPFVGELKGIGSVLTQNFKKRVSVCRNDRQPVGIFHDKGKTAFAGFLLIFVNDVVEELAQGE